MLNYWQCQAACTRSVTSYLLTSAPFESNLSAHHSLRTYLSNRQRQAEFQKHRARKICARNHLILDNL